MPHEPSEAQQRAIIAAAVRYVIAEHSVTFDIATVRAASRASDALVEAVCAADPTVARLVASYRRRRAELGRQHEAAIAAQLREMRRGAN